MELDKIIEYRGSNRGRNALWLAAIVTTVNLIVLVVSIVMKGS